MLLYQREVGQKLWQLFSDFPSDRSGSVLEFRRRHPAGNDVVSVHLQQKKARNERDDCWFLAFRQRETPKICQKEGPIYKTVDLYEGNVLWKHLLEILQPLQRLSEGGEIRHHGPQVAL